jgi:hypothetical protein
MLYNLDSARFTIDKMLTCSYCETSQQTERAPDYIHVYDMTSDYGTYCDIHKRRSLGRYGSLDDSGHRVCLFAFVYALIAKNSNKYL